MSASDLAVISENVTTVIVSFGHNNVTLLEGWIQTPNVRGTLDIIWSCVFTIFLSSWSILCLNIPSRHEKFSKQLLRKSLWTAFVIIGPEAVLQLALSEYFEARKWTKAFRADGYGDWTLTHSFYANMGGFHLYSPDEEPFPIDAAQLRYLVKKGYITLPNLTEKDIGDRNKADVFVRALTLGQILWFLLQSIARAQQGLAITTIELTTLAFVCSAAFIFFFWLKKPMDIETHTVITIKKTMKEIQDEAGMSADYTWLRSPLEWIEPYRQWAWNLYWHYSITLVRRICMGKKGTTIPKGKLIERFRDDIWPIPEATGVPWSFLAHFSYAGILMAGWNFEFPTYVELVLWRVASSFQIGCLLFLWLTLPFVIAPQLIALTSKPRIAVKKWISKTDNSQIVRPQFRKWYSSDKNLLQAKTRAQKIRTIINDHPDWTISLPLLVAYMFIWLSYGVTRMYIIGEDLASMRALPDTAYLTPQWSQYFPHI